MTLTNKISFLLLLIIFSFNVTPASSQSEQLVHRNYALELINSESKTLKSLSVVEPFSVSKRFQKKANSAIDGNKVFLDLDLAFNKKMLNDQLDVLKLSIPRENSSSLNLLLKKVEFASSTLIVPSASGDLKGINDVGAFYWGIVEGDKTSFASVSIFENELVGIITTKDGTLNLSKLKDSEEYIFYNENDLEKQSDFVCNHLADLDELKAQRDDIEKKMMAGVVNPNNCVEVHMWANGSLFQEFGNDANALSNYLISFFSQVTLIYANEHINMVLSHVTVRDLNGNVVFGNSVRTGSFIMFLDYSPGGGGGGAGGPLCGGGGASFIGSQYQDTGVITYAEGIGTVAHEIGHVLGSPHTDVCFWNGNNTQLDDCGSIPGPWSAGACFDPFNPVLDGDIGTLMSYCGHDISLGLGQQPGDLMRWYVYTSDCLSTCDLNCIDGNENNVCDVDECYPNPIVCRTNIAQRGWAGWPGDESGNCDVALKPGESVFFDPLISGGSFSWSGPNNFSSTDKVIEVSDPGIYTFTLSDGLCTYTKDMSVTTDTCPLTSIICGSNKNNEGWTSNCHVGLLPGQTTIFRPENNISGGVWSWTGPNGYSSSLQEITISDEGLYTVSYSKDGCSVSTDMRVYNCDETILSFMRVEGVTGWLQTNIVDISPGQTVLMGPSIDDFQNSSLYGFNVENTWTGPNNFRSTNREIAVTDPGTYTYTITQATCTFTTQMTITMNGCSNPIQSFANIDNQGWQQTSWIESFSGQQIALAPTPVSGTWSWTGPNGFSASDREITVSALGTYVATHTEGACTFSQEITLTECGPNPITASYNINNQGWNNGNTDILLPSGEVYIKPLVGSLANFPDFPPTWWNQPDKWLWTGPNGFTAIGFSLRVPYDQPGVYTAAMTYGPCTWSIDFNIFNCIQGPCDDGDTCTVNDVYDQNCNCIGTLEDADNDGICDTNDMCPGLDDALIGTPCDDGDSCTENDILDQNCDCAGTEIINCNLCTEFSSDDFESSVTGNWASGGIDAELVQSIHSPSGEYSFRIRDNSFEASAITSTVIDLNQADLLKISFQYKAVNMDQSESFYLELSNDGGSTFTIVKDWQAGTDFVNDQIYQEVIQILGQDLSSNTMIRFRCDASINDDEVYLDNIEVELCEAECLDYLVETSNDEEPNSKSAHVGIESNQIIPANTSVDFHAGEYILLQGGFEVKGNAVFHAFIEGCD